MGRVWHCFVRYMASYAVLMFASYVLWLVSGASSGALVGSAGAVASLSIFCGLRALSDFLAAFAALAYPAYAVVRAVVGYFSRGFAARSARPE